MKLGLGKMLICVLFFCFLSFERAQAGDYTLNYLGSITNPVKGSDGKTYDIAYLWHPVAFGNNIYVGSYISNSSSAMTSTNQRIYSLVPPDTKTGNISFTSISLSGSGNHESARPHVLNGQLYYITEGDEESDKSYLFSSGDPNNGKVIGPGAFLLAATYFNGQVLLAWSDYTGGTNNESNGAYIYKADGNRWKNSSGKEVHASDIQVFSMPVFKDNLYLIGYDESQSVGNNYGKIYKIDSSGNISSINVNGAQGCYQGVEYKGTLYVGCGSRNGGTANIWKLEGDKLTKSVDFSADINNFGNMAIYDDKLFVSGSKNQGRSEVKYFNGTSWTTAFSQDDFKSANSSAGNSSGLNQPSPWLVTLNDKLYFFDNDINKSKLDTSNGAYRNGPSYLFSIEGHTENPDACIIDDKLTDSKTSGTQSGGSFSASGWKHTSDNNKIVYKFSDMTSGVVEFDVTNMDSDNWNGGIPGPPGYDYYFGIYDDSSGDKKSDYTGSAFIEMRANYNERNGVIKLQSGAGNEEMSEPYGCSNESCKFEPEKTYKHKLVFGGGEAKWYIDGDLKVTSTYSGTINWNHLFIGDTNYKGTSSSYTGMEDFIFSNIMLSKNGCSSSVDPEDPDPDEPDPVDPPSNSATISIYLRDDSCSDDQGYRMLTADSEVWQTNLDTCTTDGRYYCVDDNQKCSTTSGSATATVGTDKATYTPGETITVSSSGSYVTSCGNAITANIAAVFQGETKVISTETFTSKGDFSNNGSVTFTAPTIVGSYTMTVGMDYSHPPFYFNRAVTLNFEVSETGEETDCTTTEDCAENFTCEEGKCVANSTTECTTSDDCDANATCEEGYCVVKVSNSEDCIVDDPSCDEHVCQDLYCLDGCNYLPGKLDCVGQQ
jgi:hypothetical protein